MEQDVSYVLYTMSFFKSSQETNVLMFFSTSICPCDPFSPLLNIAFLFHSSIECMN